MSKIIGIISVIILFQINLFAQLSTYSIFNNIESAVFEVEDMHPNEIKMYNHLVKERGASEGSALWAINSLRANNNLIDAPSTIVDFMFVPEITATDSIAGIDESVIGACYILIELINTMPKVIKEITFEFEFENEDTQVYDIKTGDKYCVLKYNNIGGRSTSSKIGDITNSFHECCRLLTYSDASFKKLFYNKKATSVKLHSCLIKYSDGTSSSKVSIFDNVNHLYSLIDDGPLKPYKDFCKKIKEEVK